MRLLLTYVRAYFYNVCVCLSFWTFVNAEKIRPINFFKDEDFPITKPSLERYCLGTVISFRSMDASITDLRTGFMSVFTLFFDFFVFSGLGEWSRENTPNSILNDEDFTIRKPSFER